MKKQIPNISWVVKHNLCVGCGICVDSCPTKAINIVAKNGRFIPEINEEKCNNAKGCHRCRLSCPGDQVKLKELSDTIFHDEHPHDHPYIGKFINTYAGYSNDDDIRYNGASGGMTTQFLIYLLEKGYIQGAVVTKFNKNNPYMVDTFIARTKEELLSARSSKYCPVNMSGTISQIKRSEGKYAIVGLPCHLHGFRKYETIDKDFKNKIFVHIGLYCSCGRTFKLTEHVMKSRNINLKDIDYFTYRRGSGMGKMLVVSQNESGKNEYEEGFQHYYLSLRSFFNVRRCMWCVDHFAELSDISFGDVHIGKYLDIKKGISSIVTRKKVFDDILHEMQANKIITIEELPIDDLIKSNHFVKTKKHTNPSYMQIDRIFGRKVPKYEVEFSRIPTIKALKSYIIKTAQMFVGNHKSLHRLIHVGEKDMRGWK